MTLSGNLQRCTTVDNVFYANTMTKQIKTYTIKTQVNKYKFSGEQTIEYVQIRLFQHAIYFCFAHVQHIWATSQQ